MQYLITNRETRKEAADYVAHLKAEPLMVVRIEPYKSTRSLNQNRLYWAILNELASETGNESSDLHELFKSKFIGPRESIVLGEKVRWVPSTTALTTKEFTDYVERICAFCAQHGYAVQLPQDF